MSISSEKLTMPFDFTFDTSRADMKEQMQQAEAVIEKIVGK